MRDLNVVIYVLGICAVAVILAAVQDWAVLADWSNTDWVGFATLVFLGLAAEQQAWAIEVGRTAGASSIAFLPLLAVVLLFGPEAAVLFWLISAPISEYAIRRKPPLRANFNIGQYVAATALAGFVYAGTGGEALLHLPEAARSTAIIEQIGPFVLFGVVFLVVNNGAVTGAIAISQRLSIRQTWKDLVGKTILLDLLIGPIAIAVAALYLLMGAVGLLVSILPLLFVRYSYQAQQNLQLANRDLLKVLVKAIETRDPYTSGHSLRVSYLAKRIAQAVGLGEARSETIEMAALLHDIGKIEAIYTDILRKPTTLTPDERAIIQSHVTKGEDLLRTLASVPDEVALAVRHHHEREDGGGYPDGISGAAIPLGAKTIAICDAIDAMLSDRPYRDALPLSAVVEQLQDHSGTQFDPHLVDVVLRSDLLSEYAEIMRLSRSVEAESRELPLSPSHPAVTRPIGPRPRRRAPMAPSFKNRSGA